jgi:ATP-dependent exoDNAse (exonuclease V) beta subunit
MMALRHEMILASAGSGKTYALTNRFVRLLAHGAAPERIVALTFTRKAAGEFFDEILKKLASAATDAKKAEKLAAEIGAPTLGSADFLRLLRVVVTAMPRLNLGTLDGFFTRVVQNFPLELGLDGEDRIDLGQRDRQPLDEHPAEAGRHRATPVAREQRMADRGFGRAQQHRRGGLADAERARRTMHRSQPCDRLDQPELPEGELAGGCGGRMRSRHGR